MNKESLGGYAGEIARLNLSTGRVSKESTYRYARTWLGGEGVNWWIMYEEVKPWVTPFDPANRIVFGTGPLTGTLAPGAARFSVASKNVFSNGVAAGNSDGFFAPELKFAGLDHIVIQGRSRKPVYVDICDGGQVELHDASHIWGKSTWETEDIIREELGSEKAEVVSIGPAGENLVRAACIIANKNRAQGRGGIGAVMGSKNLKAIASSGTGSVTIADPEGFMSLVDEIRGKIEKSEKIKAYKKYGTHSGWFTKNEGCSIPYKNFQDAYIPEEQAKKLDPHIFQKYKVVDIGYLCPVHCSQIYSVDEGPYAGLVTEGFELNTSVNFGGKLSIDEPAAIIKGHALCSQLGLDEDNVTGVACWALECLQRDILTKKDMDGMDLDWGKHEEIFELFRKIAYRKGIGDVLAEGSRYAADLLGRGRKYAMTIKGQDLYEEVRLPVGWGLGACVASRGGGHTQGSPVCELHGGFDLSEVGQKVYGVSTWKTPTAYEGKAKLVLYTERMQAIMNSLVLCMFFSTWLDPRLPSFEELAELYSAATGLRTTAKDMVRIADRIVNMEKAFNVLHAGLRRRDDYPPKRCFEEPVGSGPFKGFKLSKKRYDQMLDEYYKCHNWDEKSGLQTRQSLQNLGLEKVACDLEKISKLK